MLNVSTFYHYVDCINLTMRVGIIIFMILTISCIVTLLVGGDEYNEKDTRKMQTSVSFVFILAIVGVVVLASIVNYIGIKYRPWICLVVIVLALCLISVYISTHNTEDSADRNALISFCIMMITIIIGIVVMIIGFNYKNACDNYLKEMLRQGYTVDGRFDEKYGYELNNTYKIETKNNKIIVREKK